MLELQVYHIPWCLWCKPPGNLVCTCDVIWFRSHSSDCRNMAEYMVRHSSVSLSVITFSTQNILELYFGRWKVIFWLIIGALFIVTVAFHFKYIKSIVQMYIVHHLDLGSLIGDLAVMAFRQAKGSFFNVTMTPFPAHPNRCRSGQQ